MHRCGEFDAPGFYLILAYLSRSNKCIFSTSWKLFRLTLLQFHNNCENRYCQDGADGGHQDALGCEGFFSFVLLAEDGGSRCSRHSKADHDHFFQQCEFAHAESYDPKCDQRDDKQSHENYAVNLPVTGNVAESQGCQLTADYKHCQRSSCIAHHSDRLCYNIRQPDVQQEQNQADENTDQSRADDLLWIHTQLCAGRKLDQHDADSEQKYVIDYFHDSRVEKCIASVESLYYRKPYEAGVSEQEHEHDQILLGF